MLRNRGNAFHPGKQMEKTDAEQKAGADVQNHEFQGAARINFHYYPWNSIAQQEQAAGIYLVDNFPYFPGGFAFVNVHYPYVGGNVYFSASGLVCAE
jgi:hypothetical protein